jgi:hypothetical protein
MAEPLGSFDIIEEEVPVRMGVSGCAVRAEIGGCQHDRLVEVGDAESKPQHIIIMSLFPDLDVRAPLLLDVNSYTSTSTRGVLMKAGGIE